MLPEEYMGQTRSGTETIDLKLLTQPEPPEYLVDGGDVLGIFIESIFPQIGQMPPVYYPVNNEAAPSMGFPVPVREDGTITIPLLGRISVRGLSIAQIEEMIRRKLMEQKIRQVNNIDVLVTLQKRRTYQVLVIRQESTNTSPFGASGMGTLNLGEVKRGTGQIVNLQAYRNDVAHALAQTGGLPGLDAENAIYILRGIGNRKAPVMPREEMTRLSDLDEPSRQKVILRAQSPDDYRRGGSFLPNQGNQLPLQWQNRGGFSPNGYDNNPPPYQQQGGDLLPPENFQGNQYAAPSDLDWERFRNPPGTAEELIDSYGGATEVVRIPVRLFPGEEVDFGLQDVILYEGDIVFIESRETEIFYTGGLLGGGQYTLPRDYDLDVLGAVSIANSRQQSNSNGGGFGNRIGGISAMNQDISVSASIVVVLRQLPDGGQIPIKVNLYKAMRSPSERVLIQPGDYIILQYTPIEAVGAFIERNLLAGSLIGIATQQNRNN